MADLKSKMPDSHPSAFLKAYSAATKSASSTSIMASLIKMANHLDYLKLTKEADLLDSIIKESTKLTDQLEPDDKNLNER